MLIELVLILLTLVEVVEESKAVQDNTASVVMAEVVEVQQLHLLMLD